MFLLVACFCFYSFFMLTFKKTTFLKEKYQRRYIFRKKQQKGIYFIGFSLVSLFRPVDVTNKGLLWNLFFIENFLFKVGLSPCGDLFFLYIFLILDCITFSPSWIWTSDLTVNSRPLYHWAIREFAFFSFHLLGQFLFLLLWKQAKLRLQIK